MDTDERVRQSIREYMAEKGIRQTQLASKLEVSPQALNQIMQGQKAKVPQSLINVLDALGLELYVRPKTTGEASKYISWDRQEP